MATCVVMRNSVPASVVRAMIASGGIAHLKTRLLKRLGFYAACQGLDSAIALLSFSLVDNQRTSRVEIELRREGVRAFVSLRWLPHPQVRDILSKRISSKGYVFIDVPIE